MDLLNRDELLTVLSNLSYKDLYNFPLVNKQYLNLNYDERYINLLKEKRQELYDKVYRTLIDHIIKIFQFGYVSFDPRHTVTPQGIIMFEHKIEYNKNKDLYIINNTYSMNREQIISYIDDRLRNISNVVRLVMYRQYVGTNHRYIGMKEVIDYWVKFDPDTFSIEELAHERYYVVQLNIPVVIERFFNLYARSEP